MCEKKFVDNPELSFNKCICPHWFYFACIWFNYSSSFCLQFFLFFLVLMKEKLNNQLNIQVIQIKKTIHNLEKHSKLSQHRVIVSTIQLRDENPIFRTSRQKISRLYFCIAVLYRRIDCLISLYSVTLLYCCFVEFIQSAKQNYLQKFLEHFKKGGFFFLFFLLLKKLSDLQSCSKVVKIGFFCSPKHVVELSFYVKTWLQETTFLVLVCFESVYIKEITNV